MVTKRFLLGILCGLSLLTFGAFSAQAQEGQTPAATNGDKASEAEAANPFTENDLVVIVGGSGRTGRLIAKELHKAGVNFRPTARDPEKAKVEINVDYHWIAADVTDPVSLATAIKGATYVISAIGNARDPINVDYQGVVNIIDAAKNERVKHFTLITSGGVTHDDHYLNRMFNDLLKWKFKSEEHLRRSGMDYTVVRPHGLLEERIERNANTGILFMQGDDAQNGMIDRTDVARVCVASLTDPDADRKTFELTNFYALEPEKWPEQFAKMKADPTPEGTQ